MKKNQDKLKESMSQLDKWFNGEMSQEDFLAWRNRFLRIEMGIIDDIRTGADMGREQTVLSKRKSIRKKKNTTPDNLLFLHRYKNRRGGGGQSGPAETPFN